MAVAAIGLALAGCGDDGTTTSTMGGSMTGNTSGITMSDTDDGSSSDVDPSFDTGGNEYGGPGVTSDDTFPPTVSDTSTITAATTGGTDTDTDSDTDTGTDTDATTTGSTLTDSGGNDYGGAG